MKSRGLILTAVLFVSATTVRAQTFTVLYNFGSKNGDPLDPMNQGIIAQGRDGNLYSTTSNGGTAVSGDIFRITPAGSVTGTHNFDGIMECLPLSGLTLGTDGNFYGTTEGCGTAMVGTVFKVTPGGAFTALYNFAGTNDGGLPTAPPIQGADGSYYGTVRGSLSGGGVGTVYRLKLGSPVSFTTLFQFDGTHGQFPAAPLVLGTDGNFYGTTEEGGSNGAGVVFKITPAGKLTVIHNFDTTHGSGPVGPLIQASDGAFYGTTEKGGAQSSGVIFKISAGGAFTDLHDFNGTTDGGTPFAGLMQGTDSNFYGVASSGGSKDDGTIFKFTSKGSFSVLHNFDGNTGEATGSSPAVSLVQHTNGVLYGDTFTGGLHGQGTFFSLNLGLHAFVSLLSTSGKAGQVIEILGNGLTGTTSVKFGAGSASFKVVSDTYMTAVVPATGTTGAVTVTTPSGIRVSNKKFKVIPSITGFSPTSGTVGTQVFISGTGLTQTTKVTFGGVAATSFTKTATQVTAVVPSGAVTGKIVITTPGGTTTSSGSFTVTTSSGAMLTGYCWGSIFGNHCGSAQDLTQCPVGQPASTPETVIGCLPPATHTVDTSRACQARNSSGLVVRGECLVNKF